MLHNNKNGAKDLSDHGSPSHIKGTEGSSEILKITHTGRTRAHFPEKRLQIEPSLLASELNITLF
jgi:hypothetical protein